MDVSPAGISAFQHAQTMQSVGIAVAKKMQDNAKAQGAAVLQLLEGATHMPSEPGKGVAIDVKG